MIKQISILLSVTFFAFGPLFSADKVSFALKTPIIPILTNGDAIAVMEGAIDLPRGKELKSAKFVLTHYDLIHSMRVHCNEALFGKPVAAHGNNIIRGTAHLKAGKNKFKVSISMKPGATLKWKPVLSFTELEFADGSKAKPDKAISTPELRLARNIHRQGEGDCHTFRIPAISKANDGSLLAVYDMRYNSSRDLQEDIDIGLSRSTDGGENWTKPRPIMDMGEVGGKPQKENGCSDPGILVNKNTGEIFVSAVWTSGRPNTHQWVEKGSEPGFEIGTTAQFLVVRSNDNGQTWSPPENWTRKLKQENWWLFAPAPGNGITLTDGTLVMPTQGRDKTGQFFSNITWSKDNGNTWHVTSAARAGTCECAVAELSSGELMLNMRDARHLNQKPPINARAVAVSGDLGKAWAIHSSDKKALPEPVCMASLISHKTSDGKHVLFFSNPHTIRGRNHMTIQASLDDGKTWPEKYHVLLDEKGSYGYSSLVMVDDDTLGILYESSQADMVFQKIPLSEILKD